MGQPAANLRVLLLTNEFPPTIYGGAGVHVDQLARALRRHAMLEVRTFGTQDVREHGWRVRGYRSAAAPRADDERLRPVFEAFARDLAMAADHVDADLVHCHTWYVHYAGLLVRHAYGIPLVITVHSLEPLRPWKRDALGAGYELSSWVERTALESADAVIAVSADTRADVLRHLSVDPERVHVIHNGVDTDEFYPDPGVDVLTRYGIDAQAPYVLFVGRVTHQKGIVHLVRALREVDPTLGVVLAAGQPDTPEIAAEMSEAVEVARSRVPWLVWIPEMVDRPTLRQLYSHAAIFVCPSVYEPFGIINLEAMACGVPVVASAVGGIPEVVVDGETGVLVPIAMRPDEPTRPVDPSAFEADLAVAINRLAADAGLRARMGAAGRERAIRHFSWEAIGSRTAALYRSLLNGG